MRRYKFLEEEEIFQAFNKVRDAFLAARDGTEVDKIIDGLLTHDEKVKIGRRVLAAEYLIAGIGIEEICRQLKMGKNTVMHIGRRLEKYEDCFILIERRHKQVEKVFNSKAYRSTGGSTLIRKRTEYTGYKRKNVKR